MLKNQETETLEDALHECRIEPNWTDEEFADIDLKDKRLDKRLLKMSAQFAVHPQAQINQACEDWASAKGAYRFFENDAVNADQILAPHQQRTIERMKVHSLVFAVQDTTYLNYSSHQATKGLGLIGSVEDGDVGLIMHSTLAVTPEGLPLGILTREIWAREDPEFDPKEQRRKRRQRPIQEKESYKWLKALRTVTEICPDGVDVVTVCDSEGDIYEMFQDVQDVGAKMLIRASQDRAVVPSGQLRHVLSQRPISGYLKVDIPAQRTRAGRTANVEVRYVQVTLRPPFRAKTCQADLRPIQVSVVWVREMDTPPDGTKPLEWLLVTNVEVNNFIDAVERVRWYRLRWNIEVFHKILKSGCKVEDCRLENEEGLIRYLTLKSVIAWRMFWMVQINRVEPHASCTFVLAEHEWQALYVKIHRKSAPPGTVPTVHQVVRWIAQLGGFLGRKSDGEPGVTVLWRGWQRLRDLSDMWLVMHGTDSD
jgi:hypothetical protein